MPTESSAEDAHECFEVTWVPCDQADSESSKARGDGNAGGATAKDPSEGSKEGEDKDTPEAIDSLRVLYIGEDDAFSFQFGGLEHELEASDTLGDLKELMGNVASIESEDGTTGRNPSSLSLALSLSLSLWYTDKPSQLYPSVFEDSEPLTTAFKSGHKLALSVGRKISIVRLDIPTAADLEKLNLS
eukprot:TRINITY_DN3125_c0_g1_i2.p1 TRINITY_DN3125_c0_g1~~TRINITY_DN3125_c0_g1_i2.p1  ORF type:complete len:187 (+),score=41.26 TRINITY_DN3125_c0_g1_i2:84-644(+)